LSLPLVYADEVRIAGRILTGHLDEKSLKRWTSELQASARGLLSQHGLVDTLKRLEKNCHNFGHALGSSLFEADTELSLPELLHVGGYWCTGSLAHSFSAAKVVQMRNAASRHSLDQVLPAMISDLEAVLSFLTVDFRSKSPVLPRNILHSYMHGVIHGLTKILDAEGMDMSSPANQYEARLMLTSELSRHYCIFAVFHTFSHLNPNHFYYNDPPGMEHSHVICQTANYSYAGCYSLRLRNQAAIMLRMVQPAVWVESCYKLTRRARSGCIMALSALWGHRDSNLLWPFVQICERLTGEDQDACLHGLAARWLGLGDPSGGITGPAPCTEFRNPEILAKCSRIFSGPAVHWYDSIFLHELAVARGLEVLDTPPQWLPISQNP